MRRIRLLLAVGAVSVLVGCGNTEIQEFRPEGRGFSVWMPGTPREITEHMRDGVPMKRYTYTDEGREYLVRSSDVLHLADASPQDIEAWLDNYRNQVLGQGRTSPVKTTKIKLAGKYPGREYVFEDTREHGRLRTRIYLTHDRFYEVAVSGPWMWVTSPVAEKFFDSFALTE